MDKLRKYIKPNLVITQRKEGKFKHFKSGFKNCDPEDLRNLQHEESKDHILIQETEEKELSKRFCPDIGLNKE